MNLVNNIKQKEEELLLTYLVKLFFLNGSFGKMNLKDPITYFCVRARGWRKKTIFSHLDSVLDTKGKYENLWPTEKSSGGTILFSA